MKTFVGAAEAAGAARAARGGSLRCLLICSMNFRQRGALVYFSLLYSTLPPVVVSQC